MTLNLFEVFGVRCVEEVRMDWVGGFCFVSSGPSSKHHVVMAGAGRSRLKDASTELDFDGARNHQNIPRSKKTESASIAQMELEFPSIERKEAGDLK